MEFAFLDSSRVLHCLIWEPMKWIYLVLAIIFEVFGTTAMKLSDGFAKPLWGVAMIVGYLSCFGFLTMALKHFEVSVVYAIWSGMGITIITIIGIFFFAESVNVWKIVCIALILIGIIGLNLATKSAH
jgi:small multidrug resistance pump